MNTGPLAKELWDMLKRHGCDKIESVVRDNSVHLDAYPPARSHDPDYVKSFDKIEISVVVHRAR